MQLLIQIQLSYHC